MTDNDRLDALTAAHDAKPPDARPPEFSEEALALDFAEAHADTLRFVAAWNRWMVWEGTRWRADVTRLALDLVRPLCRRAAAMCNWDRMRRQLASARTVQAVATLAAADRRLAAGPDQWDADPWSLNTPAGVVDLRTGEMRAHDPGEHMTKITAVGGVDFAHGCSAPAALDFAHGCSAPAARASAGAGPGPALSRACLPAVGTTGGRQPPARGASPSSPSPSPSSCAGVPASPRASPSERAEGDPRGDAGTQRDDEGGDSLAWEKNLRPEGGKADWPPPGQGAPAEARAQRGIAVSDTEWTRFLTRVTAGDAELAAFLKRMAGYALTGDTSAQALFFLYGTGANGKSVFTSTLAGIMGDYQATAPIETFTAAMGERHPTELAALRGARLVTATETEDGRRWAEARIKALTGGEAIAARYMRQDFFTFVPRFKLVIAGNHKPGLRAVDEAIRRRFHLVPFTVTIPPEERDPRLAQKLKREWPAILQWAIEGCLEWQREGLKPPKAVVAATTAYLDAQDAVSAWAEECCVADRKGFELTADLYASWSRWATTAGEPTGNRKRFADALSAKGLQEHRRNDGRGFLGLRLKPQFDPDEYWRR